MTVKYIYKSWQVTNNIHRYVKMRQYDRKTTIWLQQYRRWIAKYEFVNDKQQTPYVSIYHADVVKNNMKYMLT